jgi:ribosomal protein L11 methyltransferase
MRTWPALVVGRLELATTTEPGRLDLFQAALLDYNVTAVDETDGYAWRVFFNSSIDRDAALAGLAQQFPDLTFQTLEIPDEDWAARSQAGLRPVQIGNIIVAPPWDVRVAIGRPVTIVIQPSMGFGTGHHATTRLCLAALQQQDVRGKRVLDVGTGSGVLAIAASRLGAAAVLAIDDDPDAIHAAKENVALNPGAAVAVRFQDLRETSLDPHDIVIANLTGGLLIQAAPRLRDLMSPAARLMLSGFTSHEEAGVRAAYSDLAIAAHAQEEEWLCVTLQRAS